MTDPIHRRRFFEVAAATGLATGLAPRAWAKGPNESIRVGVMGTGGARAPSSPRLRRPRGRGGRLRLRRRRAAPGRGRDRRQAAGGAPRKAVGDFRRVLDDKAVDALVVATCNHWHAPAAILGLRRGQARLRREAVQPQPARGRVDGRRRPASTSGSCRWATSAGAGPRSSRRSSRSAQGRDRPRLFRAVWYSNNRAVDRPRQGDARPRRARLRPLARPRPASALSRQHPPLQLALVLALGQRRARQQRRPHLDLCRWGLGVDYPIRVTSARRPLPLRGRPGDARHARRHLRFRRPQDDHLGRLELQPDTAPAARATRSSSTATAARWRSPAAATRSTTTRASRSRRSPGSGGDAVHQAQLPRGDPRRARGPTARSRKATRAPCSATSATSPTAPAGPCAATRRTATSRATRRQRASGSRSTPPVGNRSCLNATPGSSTIRVNCG